MRRKCKKRWEEVWKSVLGCGEGGGRCGERCKEVQWDRYEESVKKSVLGFPSLHSL